MLRAVFAAVVCWATVGALGLPHGVSTHAPAVGSEAVGMVSAPDSPDSPDVREGERLTWRATNERSAAGVERGVSRSVARVAGSWLPVVRDWRGAACPRDPRFVSRTTVVAQRAVDLRREVFRTHPGRRVGRAEAAEAPAPQPA